MHVKLVGATCGTQSCWGSCQGSFSRCCRLGARPCIGSEFVLPTTLNHEVYSYSLSLSVVKISDAVSDSVSSSSSFSLSDSSGRSISPAESLPSSASSISSAGCLSFEAGSYPVVGMYPPAPGDARVGEAQALYICTRASVIRKWPFAATEECLLPLSQRLHSNIKELARLPKFLYHRNKHTQYIGASICTAKTSPHCCIGIPSYLGRWIACSVWRRARLCHMASLCGHEPPAAGSPEMRSRAAAGAKKRESTPPGAACCCLGAVAPLHRGGAAAFQSAPGATADAAPPRPDACAAEAPCQHPSITCPFLSLARQTAAATECEQRRPLAYEPGKIAGTSLAGSCKKAAEGS